MPIKNLMRTVYKYFVYQAFLYPRQPLDSMDYDEYWQQRMPTSVSPYSEVMPIKRRDFAVPSLIPEGSSVLDVGCGDCRMLAIIQARTACVGEIVGADISAVAIQRCRERGIAAVQVDLDQGELASLADLQFDVVLLCDILEHLSNPEKVLAEMRDISRNKVIVTIPNIAFLSHRLRLLFGRFPLNWSWHPGEHIRHWSIPNFKWWIRYVVRGYTIEQIRPLEGIPLLRSLLPNLFASSLLFVLRPKHGE